MENSETETDMMIPCEILEGIDKLAQQNNLASLNCINEVEVLRVRMKCSNVPLVSS